MLARKVSKYSWRACQPYETCYNYNKTAVKKQFSLWKVAISVLAAFFVVIFIAKVLNSVGSKVEGPIDQKTANGEKAQPVVENTKISLVNKLLGIKTAQAADFSAQKMKSACDQLTMTAGETKICSLAFFNTGTWPWVSSGAGFVSIYTAKPNYRSSVFIDNSWYHQDQPAIIKSSANSNQLGLFEIKIKAPNKIGSYNESFRLASEDKAWIIGGEFTLSIKVVANGQTVASQQPINNTTIISPTATNSNVGYNSAATAGVEVLGAQKMIQSAASLEFKNTDRQLVRVGFKNIGLLGWQSYGNEPAVLVPRDIATQSFSDNSWLTNDQIVFMKDQTVEPGQIGYFEFYLSPNSVAGNYTANFQIKIGNRVIPGSEFSL
ncbi:MAG: hypothetical protein V1692_00505, partial [bacterium]